MNRKNKQFRPILACGIAYVIWGINTPLIKTSLVSFPLFPLLALKYMIGAVVFMLLVRKKWQPLSSKLWLRIVVATFSGYFVNAILLYKGIELTGGLNTSLIYLLAPLALYFLSIRFLKERYNKKLLVGVVTGFLGAVLIIGTPYISHNSGSKFNLLGNALIVLAIATDILGTILIKPALKKVPIVQMTAIRFMIAVLLFIPFVIPGLSDLRHIHISPASYVALGFNFIFATLVAFYLYHWGFSKINGEQLSPLYYLDPMVGSVASIIILGERPTITLLGGVVLVFCGLYFGEAHKLKTGHHIGHHR